MHARSSSPTAIPLLYIHSWPGSFIEIQRLMPYLIAPSSPITTTQATTQAQEQTQAFHVITPSIPGFGFSDASCEPDFGIAGVAEVFSALMQRLGYESYVICAGGWGFDVARALAVREPARVKGVFTWNPMFREPTLGEDWRAWVKWQIARVTGARYPRLSCGYTPSEVGQATEREENMKAGRPDKEKKGRPLGPAMHQLFSLRPQTLAFSMCDSPVGLLAILLDLIATQGPASALAVRPRSPFLDPGELEMQDREYEAAGHERVRSDDTVKAGSNGRAGAESQLNERRVWTPTDILNWTMMYVYPLPSSILVGLLMNTGCGSQAPKPDFAGYDEHTSKPRALRTRYALSRWVSAAFVLKAFRHR